MASSQSLECEAEPGNHAMWECEAQPGMNLRGRGLAVAIVLVCGLVAVVVTGCGGTAPVGGDYSDSGAQRIYIVRHGDKYSSYDPCPGQGGTDEDGNPCFDSKLMGDNPPLTKCGNDQADGTARWLGEVGEIRNIVVSPYTRTLQTALPLAKSLEEKLHVEYLLSEANQPEGPHREFNINAPGVTVSMLEEIATFWDRKYGSPPIKTPENNTLYIERVKRAAKVLKERFPPSSGNLAVYTHATTSFSIAYGLCHVDDSDDKKVEEFVKHQDPIGPAGVIEVNIGADGSCTIKQTNNVAQNLRSSRHTRCGKTDPFKCNFSDYPSWYWDHSDGKGPGKCA